MNEKRCYIKSRIRTNHMVRLLFYPLIRMKKSLGLLCYWNGGESRKIRQMKNKFQGQRCFIIGNGPSLRIEDLEQLKQEKTFACNYIFDIYTQTKWRPTFYMVTDKNLLEIFRDRDLSVLRDSEVFLYDRRLVKKYAKQGHFYEIAMWGKYFIRRERLVTDKISEDVSRYFSFCQSVVCSQMELAFYLGFREIYLIGMDHTFPVARDMKGRKKISGGKAMHFKEIKDQNHYPANVEALTKSFQVFREYAETHGIRIINVTRGGKLEVFERMDLDSLFQ